MDETMRDFLKICLELGKELLEKNKLSDKEKLFLKKLDIIVNNYVK